MVAEDYYEILSWFLPGGLADSAMPQLRSFVGSVSASFGSSRACPSASRSASKQGGDHECELESGLKSELDSGNASIHKNALASA